MIPDTVNTIKKFGVAQRILQGDATLHEFFLTNIYYPPGSVFYVVDEAGIYLGSLTMDMLPAKGEMIFSNPTLAELCGQERGLYVNDEITPQDLLIVIDHNRKLLEIPAVGKNKKLTAIIDLHKFMSSAQGELKSFDHGIFSWSFDKQINNHLGPLNAYENNVFSQTGEDGIIVEILNRIGMKNKYAVEFGGWDGVYLSNIRNLIVNHGYGGMFIEGDPERSAECRENYKEYKNVTSACGFVGFVQNKKLDQFLAEDNAPVDFDFLVIDIDGFDYHIWDSLKKYKPRIVMIEINPTIHNDIMYINPRTEEHFMGTSAAAMVALGHTKGYELVCCTAFNCIFVRAEEYEKVGITDNRLNTLRNEDSYCCGKYWQTFDAKIQYKGFPTFVWHSGPDGKHIPFASPTHEFTLKR